MWEALIPDRPSAWSPETEQEPEPGAEKLENPKSDPRRKQEKPGLFPRIFMRFMRVVCVENE